MSKSLAQTEDAEKKRKRAERFGVSGDDSNNNNDDAASGAVAPKRARGSGLDARLAASLDDKVFQQRRGRGGRRGGPGGRGGRGGRGRNGRRG